SRRRNFILRRAFPYGNIFCETFTAACKVISNVINHVIGEVHTDAAAQLLPAADGLPLLQAV
ncbi:hypothetical protein, partial [Butyricicoccus sp.]|uniref:hypothetical protein n=1 Tax=Butyricicoccus sp. TaxID=2049021 RepID=UPI00373552D8